MVVAAVVLAGCAIGPNYKRPSVAEPPTFRGQATAEAASLADVPWWGVFQDPILKSMVSPKRVEELLTRPEYRRQVKDLLDRRHQYLSSAAWFQQTHGQAPLTRVAYFSMEFALSEALPIYSGGLGNVAGDQLKAASDLGVPVIGVGVLYQQGYFRQVIAADGSQEALYPYNDPDQLPITPVRTASGDLLRLPILLPGHKVWLRAWQAQVGRVVLYLLDSNDPANPPAVRGITSELYGGGAELRLQQELLLGIGGWRLLRALRLEPEVCRSDRWPRAGAPCHGAWPEGRGAGQWLRVSGQHSGRASHRGLFAASPAVPSGGRSAPRGPRGPLAAMTAGSRGPHRLSGVVACGFHHRHGIRHRRRHRADRVMFRVGPLNTSPAN